jgi:hypothetical protein
MSIKEKYQVDNLFLLIGENPLPNYVAARLLLKRGGTPYLVYTSDTEKQAKRLEEIFKNELIGLECVQVVPLNSNESDAYWIQKRITERLESISTGSIGLNYTGGTKAMAVHAYRAIFKACPDALFTYLDPRRLEMCVDQEIGERVRIKIQPEMLQVKLAKIFQIHGLELKEQPIKEIKNLDLSIALRDIFIDKTKMREWFDWYHNIFCKEARKNNAQKDWKSNNYLANLLLSVEDLPIEITEVFERQNLIVDTGELSLHQVQSLKNFAEPQHFCKYIDGLWLEDYVLNQVKKIADRNSIQDCGNDFEIPLQGTGTFQFDVAFTRGYQLFAMSVTTTSNRGLCKSKLFEAYLRARQLGGDEARVALVCCSDEPNRLRAELTILNDKKIVVFGREDIADLSEKIEQWIQKNDEDAR